MSTVTSHPDDPGIDTLANWIRRVATMGTDELADLRHRREQRTEATLQALGLHPAGELLPSLKVWTDPTTDPNIIRFVSPEGIEAARVTLSPELRVRFTAPAE